MANPARHRAAVSISLSTMHLLDAITMLGCPLIEINASSFFLVVSHSPHLLLSCPNNAYALDLRQTAILLPSLAPCMVEYFLDPDSCFYISIQHQPNQINALVAHHVRNPEIVIRNLVNRIKRILLVDNSVEQDPESPDVLRGALIRATSEDFRRSVVCSPC